MLQLLVKGNSPWTALPGRLEIRKRDRFAAVLPARWEAVASRAPQLLGVDLIAAFTAVNRIDDYAFTPSRAFHGITNLWQQK